MAGNKIEELRKKAKKILEDAEKMEEKRIYKMGQVVLKMEKSGFENFDLTKFKEEVSKL